MLSKLKYLTALQIFEQVSHWQSTRLLALLIQEVLSSVLCTKHHATGKRGKEVMASTLTKGYSTEEKTCF